jgi:secretion/DNA translocation related TadE-like protein
VLLCSEAGTISVIAVALLALGVSTTGAVAGAAALLVERHRLGAAADAAALAAADAASGLLPGEPCGVARRLAESNSASLMRCVVEGFTVTVGVASTVSGVPIEAAATAGQPKREERSAIDTSKK